MEASTLLKRIELRDFKSFAGKSIITFDSDVIGIAGPNGYRKNSANDVTCWVLGEQSAKSLRGNNMSDAIFSGSAARKAVNMAEVTLVFDNSHHIMSVESEEVEVTRRLRRTSREGEYFISKAPCRLKGIVNLVMDIGLGEDSLSIISWGNISTFIDAKSEDRHALFEETAGVTKYKERKDESLSKLNQTQDNLSHLEGIIMKLERQVNPLERQAKKAEVYLGKKKQLEVIEVSALVDEIEELSEQTDMLKKKAFDLGSQKAMHEAAIRVEDVENSKLRDEMYQLDREMDELQEQYAKLSEESRMLETRKIGMDERRKYALELASNAEKARELKAMMEEAHYEHEDRPKRLKNLEVDIALQKEAAARLEHDISYCMQESAQTTSVLNRLESCRAVLENLAKQPFNHQQAVKSVSDAGLNGILGVVSQLFKPLMNYETAISNALDGAPYHTMTVDEEAIRHTVIFLKKNQSGCATFLPLSVMKPRYIQREHRMSVENSVGLPGVVSEFVESDMQFDTLRDALFDNVAITDNLIHVNATVKLLRSQYKIVMLGGGVIDHGGSMTDNKGGNNSTPLTIQRELGQILQSFGGQQMRVEGLKNQFYALQTRKKQSSVDLVRIQVSSAQLDPIVKAKWAKYGRLKSDYEQVVPEESLDKAELPEDDIVARLSNVRSRIDKVSSSMKSERERRMRAGNEVERKDARIRQLRKDLNILQNKRHEVEMAQVRAEAKLETTLERLSSTYEIAFEYAQSQKAEIDIVEARKQVMIFRQEISSLGNVNLDASQEYKEVSECFELLSRQWDDLVVTKDKILEVIGEMDGIMAKQFQEMFDKINAQLNDVFRALSGGDRARLLMVDPEDVLNIDIDIDVQPSGRTAQDIRLFSGGEKSLIVICVLFSILKVRMMPLCIFDEVEATLGQTDVECSAKYVTQFRRGSQFIVMTHCLEIMAQYDALYGVIMQQNSVPQPLKVKLQDAIDMIDEEGVKT